MENTILCPKASQLVNHLFSIFYALCDGFDSQFNDDSKLQMVKTQWVLAFIENGIQEEKQISMGLTELRRQEKLIYVPAVGQFLNWCKSTPLLTEKFYSKEKAYRIAYDIMRGDIPDGITDDQMTIIKHAIKESDAWFLKNNPRNSTEPVFHRNYEIAMKDFLSGELKVIPRAIESKPEQETHEDNWKTLRKYGVLPQYAHLTSRDSAMEVIKEKLSMMSKKLPYDKTKRYS